MTIEVPAAYTSLTWAECDLVDTRSEQDKARLICTGCGQVTNDDINVTRIILKQELDQLLKLVEGHLARHPGEVGSVQEAA